MADNTNEIIKLRLNILLKMIYLKNEAFRNTSHHQVIYTNSLFKFIYIYLFI